MDSQLLEADPLFWVGVQASADKMLGLVRQPQLREPEQLSLLDLLVCLIGDITTEHVKEQDAQRPDCETICLVAPVFDPLWRTVDPGALKLCVDALMKIGPRTKIY